MLTSHAGTTVFYAKTIYDVWQIFRSLFYATITFVPCAVILVLVLTDDFARASKNWLLIVVGGAGIVFSAYLVRQMFLGGAIVRELWWHPRISLLQSGVAVRTPGEVLLQAWADASGVKVKNPPSMRPVYVVIPWQDITAVSLATRALIIQELTIVGRVDPALILGESSLTTEFEKLVDGVEMTASYFDWQLINSVKTIVETIELYRGDAMRRLDLLTAPPS
jgi:hypothetical protein